jgi:hypothetical protein
MSFLPHIPDPIIHIQYKLFQLNKKIIKYSRGKYIDISFHCPKILIRPSTYYPLMTQKLYYFAVTYLATPFFSFCNFDVLSVLQILIAPADRIGTAFPTSSISTLFFFLRIQNDVNRYITNIFPLYVDVCYLLHSHTQMSKLKLSVHNMHPFKS